MTRPTTSQSNQFSARPYTLPRFREMTAADLPGLMTVPDPRGPYRAPLLQFVWDWNVSDDRVAMIQAAPTYVGDDSLLMPTVAAVVHALADRNGVPVPEWVMGHRHPTDTPLFDDSLDGWYGPWLRRRAPAACEYHRVWFHHRLLDKGTDDWWLPWD